MHPVIFHDLQVPVWAFLAGLGAVAALARRLRVRNLAPDLRYGVLAAAALAFVTLGLSLSVSPLMRYGVVPWWAWGFRLELELHSYGLLLALGVAAGALVASGLARLQRPPLESSTFLDMTVWIFVGAVLGARALHMALEWREFGPYLHAHGVFAAFYPMEGMSFHGGLLGGTLGTILYCRYKGLPLWSVADCLAPGLALGTVFGRIGCFLNGCCYGVVTGSPLGVIFPGAGVLPRHPAMLYQLAGNLLTFIILLALFRNRSAYKGRLFVWWLLLYGAVRFGVEFFRRDATGRILTLGLTWAQVTSLAMFAAAGLLWLALRSRKSDTITPDC